ncbi:MAG TPA: cohesin domain-containing protein [Pseudomonadales bacterium]
MRDRHCVLILAMMLLAGAGPARALIIEFVPADQTVALGGTASVDVVIDGLGTGVAPSLGAFDLEITFDDAILAPAGIAFGGLLGDGIVTSVNGGTLTAGRTDAFELSFLFPSELDALQPSTFTLLTLSFEARSVGSAVLSLGRAILGDGFGDPLLLDSAGSGTVRVLAASAPVTEPPMLLLLGLGIGSAWLLRRR